MEAQAASFDVVISGASHTGLALALALSKAAGSELRLVLVDRGQPSSASTALDVRAFALSAATRNLLQEIGVWRRLADAACDVTAIDISDPQAASPVRDTLLSYDNHLSDGEAASVIVEADRLRTALVAELLATPGIRIIGGREIVAIDTGSDTSLTVTLTDGERLSTRLLVAADGRRSHVRALAGLKTVGWSYGQSSLVTTIRHAVDHGGRALQHFFAGGPFAVLPLFGGHRSAIVWTDRQVAIDGLMDADVGRLTEAISDRLGGQLGSLSVDGEQQAHPLELFLARDLVAGRVVLVGDAARAVHPLAGQGLNIGLRDVAALAEVIVDDLRLGLPVGDPLALERYQRWRRFDGVQQALTFDGLNRLFGRREPLVKSLRDAGLTVVDRAPWLKQRLTREAAGLTGDLPRLLQGQAL